MEVATADTLSRESANTAREVLKEIDALPATGSSPLPGAHASAAEEDAAEFGSRSHVAMQIASGIGVAQSHNGWRRIRTTPPTVGGEQVRAAR